MSYRYHLNHAFSVLFKESGLSQQKIGQKAEVPQSYISDICRNKITLGPGSMLKLLIRGLDISDKKARSIMKPLMLERTTLEWENLKIPT